MNASVFIATSLDGYIARLDGGLDWLPGDDCEPHGYDEFIATVDAIAIGRNTYETVLTFGSWPYGKMPVFVLSATMRELKPPKGAQCELISGTPYDIAGHLTLRGFKHVYVDGGVTIQGFLRAKLIFKYDDYTYTGASRKRNPAV